MTQKNGDKSFDLAVLIDSNDQYNKILQGPIKYELSAHYLHFHNSTKYVTGDIAVVNKAANFVQEIDTKTYIKAFLRNGNDITNSFKTITKIRLFKFTDENKWINHINKQKHTHCDVLVIVDDKGHPIYILHDTDVNFLNQSISYESCNEYQKNDCQILYKYAKKIKSFLLTTKWKISLTVDGEKVFKSAVCYNFTDSDSKNEFFNQSYDVALVTDDKNQIELLLSGITYIYNDNTITFKSVIPYKNGYYQKLKQCAQQKKSLEINDYRLHDKDMQFIFEKDFVKNKCMLFDICDESIDDWLEFLSIQTTSMYDIGVITNGDEYQTYFLNKTSVNCMDKMISFGAMEKFTPKHHGLITKFARLVSQIRLADFTIQNLEDGDVILNEIYLYQWDLNKDNTSSADDSKDDYDHEEMQHKNQRKDKIKRKSRKTQSEIKPHAHRKSEKKNKDKSKHKYKRKGKTQSEIKPHGKMHKKEKLKRKDSVIRPSAAKKLKLNKKSISDSNITKHSEKSKPMYVIKKASSQKSTINTNTNRANETSNNTKGSNSNCVAIVTDMNEIWDLYVQRYGNEPKNTYQFQNFTKKNDNVKSLSYKDVRELFNDRAKIN